VLRVMVPIQEKFMYQIVVTCTPNIMELNNSRESVVARNYSITVFIEVLGRKSVGNLRWCWRHEFVLYRQRDRCWRLELHRTCCRWQQCVGASSCRLFFLICTVLYVP
jgi:hypothetical protein